MRLCLACQTHGKKRVKGCCPNCGTEVKIYNDYFIPENEPFPGLVLLREFVRMVRQRDSLPQFSISKKNSNYFSELKAAIDILEVCGWDLELAKEVLQELFTNKRTAWKRPVTLIYFARGAELTFCYANVLRKREHVKEEKQKNLDAIRELDEREDVFQL